MTIRNWNASELVVVLGDLQLHTIYQVIAVGVNNEVRLKYPSGRYGLGIYTGNNWCNLAQGFNNGVKKYIVGGISIPDHGGVLTIVNSDGRGDQPAISINSLEGNNSAAPLAREVSWHESPEYALSTVIAAPGNVAPRNTGSFDVASIPASVWVMTVFVLVIILWKMGVAKSAPVSIRGRSINDVIYNPREFRSDRYQQHQGDRSLGRDRLLRACYGDRGVMDRLIEYERERSAGIADHEAVKRAIERLERDRQ